MSVALYRMYDAEGALLYVGQTANIGRRLAASHQTVRRWVADGALRDVFAHMPGNRVGIARAEVERLISPPEPSVVVGQGSGATGSLSVIRRNTGGPTNRTADGSNPSAA